MKKYFESTDNNQIFAFVDESNARSLKAHQKLGFVIAQSMHKSLNVGPERKVNKIVLTRADFEKARKQF